MIEMRHADTTEGIIRCAIDVHKALGPGQEFPFYGKALVYELEQVSVYRSQLLPGY